jgi:hypothetical protein
MIQLSKNQYPEGTPGGGPGGRAPSLGAPKDTLNKALEW